MNTFTKLIRSFLRVWHFLRRTEGPVAVEYAVLLALIVAACTMGISLVGEGATETFRGAEKALNNSGQSSSEA
jgi:pilus assembly protein Flp/PilA